MKKLKIVRVRFDTQLHFQEVPAFRGAIAQKVGLENDLFHNHLGNDGFAYRYSLIQYKSLYGQPAIVCLGEGTDEIHKYFSQTNWNIKIGNKTLEMKISKLDLNQYTMQVWDKQFAYSIRNWLALNQENYAHYRQIESLAEQILFLEQRLRNHILNFSKGIDWQVEKEIIVKITALRGSKALSYKGQKLLGFDLDFSSNVFLPDFIGLGGKVSVGFGTVRTLREKK